MNNCRWEPIKGDAGFVKWACQVHGGTRLLSAATEPRKPCIESPSMTNEAQEQERMEDGDELRQLQGRLIRGLGAMSRDPNLSEGYSMLARQALAYIAVDRDYDRLRARQREGDCVPHCSYRENPSPDDPVNEFVHAVDCPNRRASQREEDGPAFKSRSFTAEEAAVHREVVEEVFEGDGPQREGEHGSGDAVRQAADEVVSNLCWLAEQMGESRKARYVTDGDGKDSVLIEDALWNEARRLERALDDIPQRRKGDVAEAANTLLDVLRGMKPSGSDVPAELDYAMADMQDALEAFATPQREEEDVGLPVRSVSTKKARQELRAAIPRLERSLEALREASHVTQEDLDMEVSSLKREREIWRALRFARKAHEGQEYCDGEPYVWHCLRVAGRVPVQMRIVALLHDCLEDAGRLPDWLLPVQEKAIRLLTRTPPYDYERYIQQIAGADGDAGKIARRVKITDIRDHLGTACPEKLQGRGPRYRRALTYLKAHTGVPVEREQSDPPERAHWCDGQLRPGVSSICSLHEGTRNREENYVPLDVVDEEVNDGS